MAATCPSGKKLYATAQLAEDVLIELWTRNAYHNNQGPVNYYQCEDCGNYHLTSKGSMNEKLAQYLASDQVRIQREATRWLDKLKKGY